MGQTIPTQHRAVVLRSHFKLVRALLAVALIAVVGLSIALVIVAGDEDQVSSTSAARPAESIRSSGLVTGSRYDSGADEGASGKDYSKNAATGDFGAAAPESLNGPGARTD